MGIRRLFWVFAALVFAGGALWPGGGQVSGQLPIPEDFSYTETQPLTAVPFSHKFHVTEKKLGCQECHTNVFQMKKLAAAPDMTMPRLNEGQFCGACHNGTKAFATKEIQSCAKCHVKQ